MALWWPTYEHGLPKDSPREGTPARQSFEDHSAVDWMGGVGADLTDNETVAQ
jgi:hypothetical protein